MSIKNLIGKKMSKKVKFMGEDVEISKLSYSEVLSIQELAKGISEDSTGGLDILKDVIKASVSDAGELTDDDFKTFPMDELAKLSEEIMKFSGLNREAGK